MTRVAMAIIFLISLVSVPIARDDGRYAQSSNKEWFDGLHNKLGGLCCSTADGQNAPDWERTKNPTFPYNVMVDGHWHPVANTAVVPGINKVGHALVWPVRKSDGTMDFIRCFMPGVEG